MKLVNEERRRHPRLALQWSASIKRAGHDAVVSGRTANVSCGGLYCLAEEAFRPGERLQVDLLLPRDMDPRGWPIRLQCVASVVRVEPAAGAHRYGIACRILDYDVVVGLDAKGAQVQPLPAWAAAG